MEKEIINSVLSPEGESIDLGKSEKLLRPLAGRLDTLENKTVYLVDTGFGGSYKFMVQLQKWFSENIPSVTTIRKRKPGEAMMDDIPDLWEEIKEKGDAAVIGVGG